MEEKLPKNWISIPIFEIARTSSGGTPRTTVSEYWNGKIPWINSGKLKDTEIHSPSKFITELGLKKSSAKLFPISTVVIALTGATTGKVGLLEIETSTNQSVTGIFPNKNYNSKFLFYQLISLRSIILEQALGTAQPHINKKIVDETIISFPPLPEQQRIVQKLDQLFGELDTVKERYNNLITIKNTFITSCLIDSEAKKFYKRQTIGKYLEDSTERIGDDWAKYRKIGVSAKKGIIDLSVGQKKTFEKYKIVRPGDFIYNTMRVNIGSIAIYKGEEIAITSPDYVVFRVKSHLSPELLLGFLKSEQGILEIGANTKGSVRARLYFKSLSEVRMPVSEKEIQQKAELFLKSFNASLAKLKTLIHSKIPKLEQAILAKAFKGELVPQLDTDGNARDILKEVEALQKQPKMSKKKK